jgi:hypothetical protein
MDVTKGNRYGHSADVRMHLTVNGYVVPIAQLGSDFMILRTPVEHAPADAEIFLSIDGDERRWMVHLDNGIHPDRLRTAISPVPNAAIENVRPRESRDAEGFRSGALSPIAFADHPTNTRDSATCSIE